jgi:pimeloyl-ACP methyl ester carboxylesterase
MKKTEFILLAAIAFLSSSTLLFSQQTAEKYIVEMNYLQYLPQEYANDTITRFPVLVFLHGVGETGSDIRKVRGHGLPRLIEEGRQFPFIVISPQSRVRSWDTRDLHDLLQNAFAGLRVDRDRIYLTGLSMGGYGTWNMAISHPEMFAAIAPICGGGSESGAARLRNIPVWCFHGDADDVVSISESEKMVNASKKYNPNVKFTVYPGVGHDSWTQTYDNEALFDWLLQQKRHKNVAIELDRQILEQYVGTYQSKEGRTVRFTVEGNGLKDWYDDWNGSFWQPESENEFFFKDNYPDLVRFNKGENGEIESVSFISYGEYVYKRKK